MPNSLIEQKAVALNVPINQDEHSDWAAVVFCSRSKRYDIWDNLLGKLSCYHAIQGPIAKDQKSPNQVEYWNSEGMKQTSTAHYDTETVVSLGSISLLDLLKLDSNVPLQLAVKGEAFEYIRNSEVSAIWFPFESDGGIDRSDLNKQILLQQHPSSPNESL